MHDDVWQKYRKTERETMVKKVAWNSIFTWKKKIKRNPKKL